MITRTGAYPTWIALVTLIRKEIRRFMRIWTQTLIPPAITMSLYFIIFGKFIGSHIQFIEGYAYIQFIVPGLVLMAIMTNAYSNTASSFFLTKFNKSIEEMLVTPMPSFLILVGFMFGGTIRGIVVGMIVLVIAFLFTHIPLHHLGMICGIAVLVSMVFSLAGLINGIYARRFDDITFIPTFVLTPLTYLGGVFYSVNQLSPFWRKLSYFNPILCMVDTFRFSMLNISGVKVSIGLSVIILMFFIMFFWALALLRTGYRTKS